MSFKRTSGPIAVLLLFAALAYLRDPPWLIGVESGFRPWERAADGVRSRWTGGHASLFIPSTAALVTLPVRTTFVPGDSPVTVTITVDDRRSVAAELRDDAWHRLTLRLPDRSTRRVRRIDIHVDRTRPGNRGVAVGDLELR